MSAVNGTKPNSGLSLFLPVQSVQFSKRGAQGTARAFYNDCSGIRALFIAGLSELTSDNGKNPMRWSLMFSTCLKVGDALAA